MRIFSARIREGGRQAGFLAFLTGMVFLCATSYAGAAIYLFDELSDDEIVSAISASGENTTDLTVIASGYNDLVNEYANASFEVYGILAEDAVINQGIIDIGASGGDIFNLNGNASANLYAAGIYTDYGDIDNYSEISVTALGGITATDYYAYAYTSAVGIHADDGTVYNEGDITVTATGGTATGYYDAEAYAHDTYGIFANDDYGPLYNSGDITVTATGGTASSDVEDATAYAHNVAGIEEYYADLTNDGAITVSATGGTAMGYISANADTENVYGIYAYQGSVDNSGGINLTATGGEATAYSDADASVGDVYGIYVDDGFVDNEGGITVTATGGTAASEDGNADTNADAEGITTEYASVTNSGTITVTGAAGTATGYDEADAWGDADGIDVSYGDVNNSGNIAVTAEGGSATAAADADAGAEAEGISTYEGDITNTGNVLATASGGTATATTEDLGADAYAYADAYAEGLEGIYGSLTNEGDVTVSATGGTTSATESYTANAPVTAVANSAPSGEESLRFDASATAIYAYDEVSDGNSSEGSLIETGTVIIGSLDNIGNISATATGGGNLASAVSNWDAYAFAGGIVQASGINIYPYDESYYSHLVLGYETLGDITDSTMVSIGDVDNKGNITVTATGAANTATATANWDADAYAGVSGDEIYPSTFAAGINAGADDNVGYVADGLITNNSTRSAGNVANLGDVTVTVTGSDNTATVTSIMDAGAIANGWSGASGITTSGRGSSYSEYGTLADASSNAFGNLANEGDVTVSATSGTSTAQATGNTSASAMAGNNHYYNTYATGINANGRASLSYEETGAITNNSTRSGGNVDNIGNITVTATGGDNTADAESTDSSSYAEAFTNSDVLAQGINANGDFYTYYDNTGNITDNSTQSFGNVTNTGDIEVLATNTNDDGETEVLYRAYATATGDASSETDASAMAYASGISTYGYQSIENDTEGVLTDNSILSFGNVDNYGDILVDAFGGEAEADTTLTGNTITSASAEADAVAQAYGIQARSNLNGQGNVDSTGALFVYAAAGEATATVTYTGDTPVYSGGGYTYANAYADADVTGISSGGMMVLGGMEEDSYSMVGNSGDIWAIAIGGMANADFVSGDNANASATADATGIGFDGDVSNSGDLLIWAMAGDATATGADDSEADADADAQGISNSGTIDNDGDLDVMARGGDAYASSNLYTDAEADADVYGLDSGDSVVSTGYISVYADGGEAEADSVDEAAHASANADAEGIYASGSINNSGDIDVYAGSGYADAHSSNDYAYAYAYTDVYGLDSNDAITNHGGILVRGLGGYATATGSEATNANANTVTVGISSGGEIGPSAMDMEIIGSIENYGDVDAYGKGGYAEATSSGNDASADAIARVYGLNCNGTIENYGNITIEAMGGSAEADGDDPAANAGSFANGIFSSGTVLNEGDISVSAGYWSYVVTTEAEPLQYEEMSAIATGVNYATANASAQAEGIYAYGDIDNSGNIDVYAEGGSAAAYSDDYDANANAEAYAYGLDSGNAVTNNSGDIHVEVWGGTAEADAYDYAYADADAYVYGIYADGPIENSGDIDVYAEGGSADAYSDDYYANANTDAGAYGLESDDAVTNHGDIYAGATGGNADANGYDYANADAGATAYGIAAYGDVDNSGMIIALAGDPGYLVEGAVPLQGSGYLTATATSEYSADATADAEAYGIDTDGVITNSGILYAGALAGNATATSGGNASASAEADAYALYSEDDITNYGDILIGSMGGTAEALGSDEIHADASAYTDGIDGWSVYNSGDMDAYAYGGDAYAGDEEALSGYASAEAGAEIYGLCAYEGGLTNYGGIYVRAFGGYAGAFASNDADAEADAYASGLHVDDGTLENSGMLIVEAEAGTAYAAGDDTVDASAEAWAAGIEAYDSDVENSGDIYAYAEGGYATELIAESEGYGTADAHATGIAAENSWVYNTGDILAEAVAQEGFESYAAGITFTGDEDSASTLTNTGTLQAFADYGYEVAVEAGSVTLEDFYNMTLDGDPMAGSIYVASGATMYLNDATLGLTTIVGETIWDTEYRIFDEDTQEGIGGTIDGAFDGLSMANPNVTPTYLDQGTGNSQDDGVIIEYTPVGSPLLEGAHIMHQTGRMTAEIAAHRQTNGFLFKKLVAGEPLSSRLFADAGTTASDASLRMAPAMGSNGFYVAPYYNAIQKDDTLKYDATTKGLIIGFDHWLDSTLFGLHAGFGSTDLDYDGLYDGSNEDQDYYSLGVHGMGNFSMSNWTWRSQLSGYWGSHDYSGLTGLNLDQLETGSYDSKGVLATLMLGYAHKTGNQVLLPELGLDYQYFKADALHTSASDPNWDLSTADLSESQLTAVASLEWLGNYKSGDMMITPALSVGIRYLLTDDSQSVTQYVGGSTPVIVDGGKENRTSGTLGGSLTFGKDNLSAEVSYQGEFGSETTMHSVWLQLYYRF